MAGGFQAGQRWISETEPELGLGSIQSFTKGTVTLLFSAAAETRQYALDTAPLRRVQFHRGDRVTRKDGAVFVVDDAWECNGLHVYRSGGCEFTESDLSDQISFSTPEERLLNGQVDPPVVFNLRCTALQHQHRRRKSAVRGFVGGRIELIPHQLYIAAEVASRLVPRVLLADEVGLGKTIEAGLILHRLIQTGRAQRVLVLVPEALIHQWFVELLRRFNLWFHIFDEERCEAMELTNPDVNPFLEDQWILAGIGFLGGSDRRRSQALAADWDVLVVDEAHHLGWASQAVSPDYALVEALAAQTPGLLLLTATPEQLGIASHFARLRLLDPDRYYNLEEFLSEAGQYREVALIADKLLRKEMLSASDRARLAQILGRDEGEIGSQLAALAHNPKVGDQLIEDLLDQHGTGRVMFRNTRATVTGFPNRIAHLYPLAVSTGGERLLDELAAEFDLDANPASASGLTLRLSEDPRLVWLADLLRTLGQEKILCICRSRLKVEAMAAALAERINARVALFHEDLPLVHRDRNAAWFAEEGGAQILLASEIGSEGRNFQFAHHLVQFDLPLDPDLLEQRIGRLDRIGQRSVIHVHVPFVRGSPQEVLARWFHEGLNAFEKNLRGGHQLFEHFGPRVKDLAQDFHETHETSSALLEELILETRAARDELAVRLERGRDHLLELNSFRPGSAERLVRAIQQEDEDSSLDLFMLSIFDHYGIHVEELAKRTYAIGSAGVFADTFPGLSAEGFTVTTDRGRALAREEIQFLTWDHPLVTGALDLMLGSGTGSSSLAHWPDPRIQGLYLEAVYLVECVAPPSLHLDRFLPPTPVRVIVDHRGLDASSQATAGALHQLKPDQPYPLLAQPQLRHELIPFLIRSAENLAGRKLPLVATQARAAMNAQLEHEILRLRELQKVNRNVRAEEVDALVEQQRALDRHLAEARLRLDAIRLIRRGAA